VSKRKGFARKLPVVEVIWADCLLFTGGWEAHSDVMRQRKAIRQRSVGYVLADDKRGIMLTESLSQGGNVYGTVVIPAAQIISRRDLK
jgi:hypothetical protein